MASKFEALGTEYSSSNCCFAKADITEATFIMNQVEEGALPIIQAYVKKAKINEIRGPSDELKNLIDNAIAQVV
jgi:hypothetical protein